MSLSFCVKNGIRLFLLTAFAVGALAGCAVLEEATEQKAPPGKPIVHKPPAKRELGSLWSEDSMWNHVYTAAAARVVGDIVTVKLDDSFRARLSRLKGDGSSEKPPASTGNAAASAAPAEGEGEKTAHGEDMVIRGTIEEVGPRGVYRISASDTVRLGTWEPFLMVKGRVRDRDIDANDEIRIADVVDLNYDILKVPPTGEGKDSHVSW